MARLIVFAGLPASGKSTLARAVAEDNLRLGRAVIADCVNDWQLARDGWPAAGARAGAEVVWLEVICSDPAEHRRRVETRDVGIPGLPMPDWQAIQTRDYHAWNRPRRTIDTAGRSIESCVEAALAAL